MTKNTTDGKTARNKVTLMSLIMTMGIVFGDIGTSPLYVFKAILSVNPEYDADFVIGAISCVIWTLTLQTTVKYVLIALRADNKGEGGIFALFSHLQKSRFKWLYAAAIIGGAALVADGVITPAITVTTAIEGLRTFNPDTPVIPIVLVIVSVIFIIQYFGTKTIGMLFGPIMSSWFLMLGVLGLLYFVQNPVVAKAFNPLYAVKLLSEYPGWFFVLGAVFLCTTGAEALYSDLGHCGRKNITISWCLVKLMLILNYLGQGAWILSQPPSSVLAVNPFYGIMPQWFLGVGIVMSTLAAIIASQALLSGSFTLFSEAISLNFFPRVRIKYPTSIKGQLFIPLINIFLYIGCVATIFIFRDSSHMEAAYGLAITITMLMTTVLLCAWMKSCGVGKLLIAVFGIFFLSIEILFLIANASKFMHGGWYTLLISAVVFAVMYVWFRATKIRSSYIEWKNIYDYIPVIRDIKADKSIPLYASNLVYISYNPATSYVESKLIYSIINKHPKRADHYWLIRIEYTDSPNTLEYECDIVIPDTLYNITIRLGFRVKAQVNVYFRQIVEDLEKAGKVNITSSYPSLSKYGIAGNFRFVIIHRRFSADSSCSAFSRLLMKLHSGLQQLALSKEDALGLDTSSVSVETVPLIINNRPNRRIKESVHESETDEKNGKIC